MSDTTELLPCPFCGGGAAFNAWLVDMTVQCQTCGGSIIRGKGGKKDYKMADAITAWNTRTPTRTDTADEPGAMR